MAMVFLFDRHHAVFGSVARRAEGNALTLTYPRGYLFREGIGDTMKLKVFEEAKAIAYSAQGELAEVIAALNALTDELAALKKGSVHATHPDDEIQKVVGPVAEEII